MEDLTVTDQTDRFRNSPLRGKVPRPILTRPPSQSSKRNTASSVELDGLTSHLGYLTRRAQLWIFQDFNKTLAPLEIRTAQYSVLTVIGANPGLSQMALAQALGIERARLVHLLDGLEARNLLERVPSTSDRRTHAMHLTSVGRTFLRKAKDLAAEHERHVAKKFGSMRRQQLLKLLSVLAHG
jgi:DNA-binding MarR family transcriptional regulator